MNEQERVARLVATHLAESKQKTFEFFRMCWKEINRIPESLARVELDAAAYDKTIGADMMPELPYYVRRHFERLDEQRSAEMAQAA